MTREESLARLIQCIPKVGPYLTEDTQEIRLRVGQPVTLTGARRVVTPWRPDREEILRAAEALTGRSLHARVAEAKQGALCIPGGHRLGLCGAVSPEGFAWLSGFCLRIAGQWPGAADELIRRIGSGPASLLIIGPPGSGKTTMLRDLCRQWSVSGIQTALCDDRGELAALWEGIPQLDVGPMTDVLSGCPKGEGLFRLIRHIRPEVVFTDELDRREEAAVSEALRCGVKVCASTHGASVEDARRRFSALWDEGCFDGYAVLNGGRLSALYHREGTLWE